MALHPIFNSYVVLKLICFFIKKMQHLTQTANASVGVFFYVKFLSVEMQQITA